MLSGARPNQTKSILFRAVSAFALGTILGTLPCAAQNSDAGQPEAEVSPQENVQAPPDKRIFGVLPNYRTADGSRPFEPLTAKAKFYIGFKDSTDYPIYLLTGMFAGIAQAEGSNPTFGGGVQAPRRRLRRPGNW